MCPLKQIYFLICCFEGEAPGQAGWRALLSERVMLGMKRVGGVPTGPGCSFFSRPARIQAGGRSGFGQSRPVSDWCAGYWQAQTQRGVCGAAILSVRPAAGSGSCSREKTRAGARLRRSRCSHTYTPNTTLQHSPRPTVRLRWSRVSGRIQYQTRLVRVVPISSMLPHR